MKKAKLIFVLLISSILISCGHSVKLQDNFVLVESVQVLSDSSYIVNLKCDYDNSASLTTPYRYQAGDTLWSETQLKKHDNKLTIELNAKIQEMKDSAFFYRVSLGNKIEDLNKQVKDLQMQNNALQKTLVKLK
jgi:uncharacterized protein involved in exopolysaccharide biosynthesis